MTGSCAFAHSPSTAVRVSTCDWQLSAHGGREDARRMMGSVSVCDAVRKSHGYTVFSGGADIAPLFEKSVEQKGNKRRK